MREFFGRTPATRRRGSVVVLTAITMMTLLCFGALAVDVGYICSLVAEMQNTADASSLAGASALRDGQYDMWKERTFRILGRNQKLQGFQSLDDQVVEVGRWDRAGQTFTRMDPSDANHANAVRVVSKRNRVQLFFAAIMGKHTTNVAREAVAQVTPTCAGIWGLESVDVPGNVVVDSFDSSTGAYSMATASDNGDVCSNGPLTVAGSIEINGDTLGSPVTVHGGKAVITGSVDTLEEPVVVPPPEFGDVAVNNDNASIGTTDKGASPFSSGLNVQVGANDNLTLPPGTFYFESVTFRAAATLTVTGPTTIYVAGDFDQTGQSTVNTTGDPHDLTIISAGKFVNVAGGASFAGSIMAPNAEVSLTGNADFFGAVVGRTVKIAGSFDFHVDESLELVHSLKPPPKLVR